MKTFYISTTYNNEIERTLHQSLLREDYTAYRNLPGGVQTSYGTHADIPFLKYFNDLVATKAYNDVLFVSEKNENIWWYDGERIALRTPSYTKNLNAGCDIKSHLFLLSFSIKVLQI